MFFLYHHHQLDRLATLQAALLGNAQRNSVLTPDTIIVPNQGVARWLQIQLAESEGIAANLHLPLPAKFIWETVPKLAPSGGDSRAFERHRLRWHLYALLPQLADQVPQITGYLQGAGSDILRLQLAEQLADVFDQYLVFRPQMLFGWQAGTVNRNNPTEQWQAAVWRALVNKLGIGHRGKLLHEAIAHCQQAPDKALSDKLPQAVYGFGLGSLPPDYLRFLYAISRHCEVHFLLLNPCEHYWGEIQSQRVHSLAHDLAQDDATEIGVEQDHPLLASLGRGTRDLLRVLYSQELQAVQEPQLGAAMAYEPPQGASLLAQVQTSVIKMQATPQAFAAGPPDASIQIHACHGPLREVQVLHDQLLDLLSADPTLQARDIIVMMPDTGRYAAAIAGVFGAAQGARHIEYSLSDHSRVGSHPIVRSFSQLLNLPLSRWSLSEILDLARVPAVMRRFGLDADSLDQAEQWLQQAGVRWGLDASTRRQFEAGEHAEYSWQFGLDRLLLGLSMNDDSTLFDGVAAWTDLEGGSTASVGQIWLLLQRLRHWQQHLETAQSATEWQQSLNLMLDDLLDNQNSDEAEQAALQELRHAIDSLTVASECLGEETLSWLAVREILLAELNQAATRQPFLSNGVSFCGMVPLRAVPFKVVCMLGMDDGAFPRQDKQGQFNLLRTSPRLGDISVRDDDRLLFLQSIMAAGDVFYISYTGLDLASGDVLPPAPIVGEWLDFLQQHYFHGMSRKQFEQHIIARQPMHPFSPALFGADPPHPRVFSFQQAWLGGDDQDHDSSVGFIDQSRRTSDVSTVIELDSLRRFFDHPARFFLRDLMQIQRQLPQWQDYDSEPLQLDALQSWSVRSRLLRDAQEGHLPAQAPAHLLASGLLPPPPLDQPCYQQEVDSLHALLPLWQLWKSQRGDSNWLDIDLVLGQYRLRGRLSGLWPDGPRLLRVGSLRMQYRLRSWIDYLCYVLSRGQGHLQLAGINRKKQQTQLLHAQIDTAQAQQHLLQLLDIYLQGQHQPLAFLPDLADSWLIKAEKCGDDGEALEDINAKLNDRHNVHSARSDAWFSPLLNNAGELPETFCELSRLICAPVSAALHERDVQA